MKPKTDTTHISREEVADVLRLAPPYGTLEQRKLRTALKEAQAQGLGGSEYAREIEAAIRGEDAHKA